MVGKSLVLTGVGHKMRLSGRSGQNNPTFGEIYLLGGYQDASTWYPIIYRSANGETWTQWGDFGPLGENLGGYIAKDLVFGDSDDVGLMCILENDTDSWLSRASDDGGTTWINTNLGGSGTGSGRGYAVQMFYTKNGATRRLWATYWDGYGYYTFGTGQTIVSNAQISPDPGFNAPDFSNGIGGTERSLKVLGVSPSNAFAFNANYLPMHWHTSSSCTRPVILRGATSQQLLAYTANMASGGLVNFGTGSIAASQSIEAVFNYGEDTYLLTTDNTNGKVYKKPGDIANTTEDLVEVGTNILGTGGVLLNAELGSHPRYSQNGERAAIIGRETAVGPYGLFMSDEGDFETWSFYDTFPAGFKGTGVVLREVPSV